MSTWGPRSGKTLTPDQKKKVKELRDKGMDYASLRERFGCSQMTIVRAIKEES